MTETTIGYPFKILQELICGVETATFLRFQIHTKFSNHVMIDGFNRHIVDFVFDFLHQEGIPIAANDVGDRFPRKLLYFPHTGIVRVRKLKSTNQATVVRREAAYFQDIKNFPRDGDIDLF